MVRRLLPLVAVAALASCSSSPSPSPATFPTSTPAPAATVTTTPSTTATPAPTSTVPVPVDVTVFEIEAEGLRASGWFTPSCDETGVGALDGVGAPAFSWRRVAGVTYRQDGAGGWRSDPSGFAIAGHPVNVLIGTQYAGPTASLCEYLPTLQGVLTPTVPLGSAHRSPADDELSADDAAAGVSRTVAAVDVARVRALVPAGVAERAAYAELGPAETEQAIARTAAGFAPDGVFTAYLSEYRVDLVRDAAGMLVGFDVRTVETGEPVATVRLAPGRQPVPEPVAAAEDTSIAELAAVLGPLANQG